MKITVFLLFISYSLLTSAQTFISDNDMTETVMVEDDQLKILYFTASWCGPCKRMKPVIKEIAADPESNVTIFKMDIDKNYTDDVLGVNSVPTFMYLKNGIKLGESKGAKWKQWIQKEITDYDSMKVEGERLNYKPVPSNLKPVAGTHSKLSRNTVTSLWHDYDNLISLSNSIYQNLTDLKDLKCGLNLAKRAQEIKNTDVAIQLIQKYESKLK